MIRHYMITFHALHCIIFLCVWDLLKLALHFGFADTQQSPSLLLAHFFLFLFVLSVCLLSNAFNSNGVTVLVQVPYGALFSLHMGFFFFLQIEA